MSTLTFQMLQHTRYIGEKNNIDQIHVEHLVDDEWQQLEMDNYSHGFDSFMFALINCQQTYFRMNAAEYGLVLSSSDGFITVICDEHRRIDTLNVEIRGKLLKGEATQEMIDSITARMALCPVSINLMEFRENHTAVSFEPA